MTLTNHLEKNSAVGEYRDGVSADFKLNSVEQQKKIFDEINN